jgi:hypothetical protein
MEAQETVITTDLSDPTEVDQVHAHATVHAPEQAAGPKGPSAEPVNPVPLQAAGPTGSSAESVQLAPLQTAGQTGSSAESVPNGGQATTVVTSHTPSQHSGPIPGAIHGQTERQLGILVKCSCHEQTDIATQLASINHTPAIGRT